MLFSNSDSVTFIHYTEADGLPNNFIYGILEDDEGNLWLSTNKGISRFNPETETFRNYDLADGLQSNEFNRNAYYKSRQGELFFGGIKGLNYFFPHQIKDNPYIPPVVITDFRIFNESISPNMVPMKGGSAKTIGARSVWPLQKDIKETNEIMLSYADKVFSFEFVALDYTAPEKNRYEYIMEGFDEDWVHAGTKREATYTNLDHGEYTFRVKGSNNDGVWNEDGTSLRITIVPPYWQTWWFRTACIIALFALAFTGYRIKINSMRERNIVLQKEVTARKQATTDMKQSRAAALNLMEDAIAARDQSVQANTALQSEMAERKQAEEELRQKMEELRASNDELELFNRASVGRELRMIELKQEINELCRLLGEPPRHATDQLQTDSVPGAGPAPAPPGRGGA
jgi:PAS domain-containing protein